MASMTRRYAFLKNRVSKHARYNETLANSEYLKWLMHEWFRYARRCEQNGDDHVSLMTFLMEVAEMPNPWDSLG